MPTNYIDLNSEYRNRKDWPNPAQFQVDFRHTGNQSALNAKDPVSEQSPTYSWNSSFQEDSFSDTVNTLGLETGTGVGDPSTISVLATQNTLREPKNFYVGAVIQFTDGSTVIKARIAKYQLITRNYIGPFDQAQITLDEPLTQGYVPTSGFIVNPTNDTSTALVPQVFIPAAPDLFNSFVGMQVVNVDTNESREIIAFDAITRMATLSSNTTTNWFGTEANFVIREKAECGTGFLQAVATNGRSVQLSPSTPAVDQTGNFVRMTEPTPITTPGISTITAPYTEERRIVRYFFADGTFLAHGGAGTNTFTLSSGSTVDSTYVGMFVTDTTTGETREIATYTGATRTGTVTTNWTLGGAGDTFVIRTAFLESPFSSNPDTGRTDSGVFAAFGGVGTNTFTLANSASTVDNYYVGYTILNSITPETRIIATYDGATRSGTVTNNWSAGAAGDAYEIGTGRFPAFGGAGTNTFQLDSTVSSTADGYYVGAILTNLATGESRVIDSYTGATQVGTVSQNWTGGGANDMYILTRTRYELECFTEDNAYPLSYSGSMTSQQGDSCFEIELLKLVLPNGTLNTGAGGRIAFFPYIYVELTNLTSPNSGVKNIIYSNNPNARRMLFKCTVDDTTEPTRVPFAKLSGNGMRQTIKFKPNDILRFSVYLPNGELFQLATSDNVSPTPPNPLVQISATFSIRKLD